MHTTSDLFMMPHCTTGIVFVSLSFGAARSDVCSFGGTNVDTTSEPFKVAGQYLDLRDTASCNGNITSIRYCYLLNDTNSPESDNATQSFFVRIWRESNDCYKLVKEYEIIIGNTVDDNASSSLNKTNCSRVPVHSDATFEVLSGDVIGLYFELETFGLLATIPSSNSESNSSDYELHFDTRASNEVRFNETITLGDLSIRESLHYGIQVQIGKPCMFINI